METFAPPKQRDLGLRTFDFARDVRELVRKVPRTIDLMEDCKQLVRSSGSVGANYIEANEALSRKDQIFRMRITKKEARESAYWLHLLDSRIDEPIKKTCASLMNEAEQLVRIFSSIILKSNPERSF